MTETFLVLINLSSHGPGKYVKLSQRSLERDFSWSNHATRLIIDKVHAAGLPKPGNFPELESPGKRLRVLESS